LHTASALFESNGGASIGGSIHLPTGSYETLIYTLGVPSDKTYSRANLAIKLDALDLLPDAFPNIGQEWHWIAGEPITAGPNPETLVIQASHLLGQEKSFADVGYVGFIRQRNSEDTPAPGPVVDDWPGEVNVEAGSTRSWTIEVDADIGRVDIWAFVGGPDGKVYRIYDIYNDGFSVTSTP